MVYRIYFAWKMFETARAQGDRIQVSTGRTKALNEKLNILYQELR